MVSKELQGKILFPWDGSPLAEQALPFATFMARLPGTELLVFRALLPPRADMVVAPDLGDKDLSESAYNDAKKEIAQLCASCGEEEVKANWEVAIVDAATDPLAKLRDEFQDILAAQIVGRAAKPDIGLVVLGSHGASVETRSPGAALRLELSTGSPSLFWWCRFSPPPPPT